MCMVRAPNTPFTFTKVVHQFTIKKLKKLVNLIEHTERSIIVTRTTTI